MQNIGNVVHKISKQIPLCKLQGMQNQSMKTTNLKKKIKSDYKVEGFFVKN